jgi:hypothetical protein
MNVSAVFHLAEAGGIVLAGSLVASLAALIVIRYWVVRIPADYFSTTNPQTQVWRRSRPTVRAVLLVLKNLLGLVLFVAGLLMLITPGPGILALLLGLSLLDFPGKRILERRLVRIPSVLNALNRVRLRRGRPPLVISP